MPGKEKTMRIRHFAVSALNAALFLTAFLPVSYAATPDGFVVYSKGNGNARTLYMRKMTQSNDQSDGLQDEQLICEKGKHGDIQSQISFDGKMLAFSRSTGASGEYGEDDYHDFADFDVYIVQLDGGLPATPKKVGRGYWPSWSDDSHNATKTLYYSTHPEGAIRAVTVSSSGGISDNRLIYNVRASSIAEGDDHYDKEEWEGFLMAGPTGEWAAFRYDGTVFTGHWAGEFAGQRLGGVGGCMPSVTADGKWIINARYGGLQTSDGNKIEGGVGGDGAGPYHFGSSADMEWFVSRITCGATKQNIGCETWLYKLTATSTSFSTEKQVKITDDGSWPDVHAGPLSNDVSIKDFRADPANIAQGGSATLQWSVYNATSLTINGEAVTGESKTVSPAQTTEYTLTAQGENGPVSESVTITVAAAELTAITISPDQASIAIDESVDFAATPLDQSGNEFAADITWTLNEGGSLSASSGATTTFASDGTAGVFAVTASSGDVQQTATVTVKDPNALHMKINCGHNDQDVTGWERDDPYMSGGSDYTFGGSVATDGVQNAAPEGVYLSVVHYANAGDPHYYDFADIPDGMYTVRMHFNDGIGGDRSMNYSFEGEQLITDLDIDGEAGGTDRALVKEVTVTVADGNGLQIECAGSGDSDVFEAGIEIIGFAASGGPTESITVDSRYDGESFAVGDEITIDWTATNGVGSVLVQVSADGGKNWLPLNDDTDIDADDPLFGSFPWTVTAEIGGVNLISDNVQFKVMDYLGIAASGISGTFAITEPATIMQPNLFFAGSGMHIAPATRGFHASITVPDAYRIEALDLKGRTLFCSEGSGPATIRWNGAAATGTYILRMRLGHNVRQRVFLLR